MQDKRDELYSNLIKSGKVDEEQIGTIDQFKSSVKDEATAKKFHENLMSAGFSADEVGDSDNFYGAISSDFQSPESASLPKLDIVTKVTHPSAPVKKDVEIFGGIPYSEYQRMPGEDRLQAYSKWKQGKDKDEQSRLRGANTNQVESLYADVSQEMEALSVSDKVDEPAGAAFIPAGAYGAAQRYGNTQNKEKQDRYTMLESAKDLLENSQEIAAEAGKKGNTNFFGGAVRGIRDKAFNLDTWAMGVTDLCKNKFIQSAAQKSDKGVELTQEEQRLLDAATVNMVAQALFSSDLGRGYKAGGVTAESLPFMLEMIANPAAAAGKGVGNAILRYGVKKFGAKAAEKVTGTVAKKLLGNVAKASTRMVGDVLAASTMTATSGIARTAADAISRETGQVKYSIDKDGNAEYVAMEGGVSNGKAAYKAFAGNTIETFSEMFGRYFEALGGTLTKIGPMQALKATKVGEAFSKINSSDWAKAIARFERGANYNGTFGEYGEEVVGTVLNSIFTGDQSLSELADVDQQIDTFLGVSLMGGFMSSAKALGYRTPKYEAEKKLGKAERTMESYFGEDWNTIQLSLEEANTEDRKAYLNNVFSSEMNTDEKEAMFDYVSRLTIRDAIKAGDEKLVEEGIDLSDGIAQNKASVYNGYNEAAKKALQFVAVEDIDEIDQQIEVGADIDYIRQFIADKGMSEEQSEALMDYSVAKQDFNDYLNGVQSRIDSEKANARRQVESVSNPDMGATVRVKSALSENPVHVIGGKLVFDEQGFVDEKLSDGVIYCMDENGKRKMAAPSMFESLIDSTPTEELVVQAESEAEDMIITQEDAELSPMEVGQIVYTPDGVQGEVTRFTAEGNPIVLSDSGEQVFKKEQLTLSAANEQNVVNTDISSVKRLESNSVPVKGSNVAEPLNELPPQISKTSFEENGRQTISESVQKRTMESLLLELPKKKDGVLDYKAMTPRQTFEYTKFSEGGEVAISDLQADIIDATEELNKFESKVGKAKGAERIELREQSKVIKSRLSELQAIMREAVPVTTEEVKVELKQAPVMDADMLEWTADNSNDANELLSAYNQAKEMASHDLKLKPWEQSLLGRKVSTDSFMRFADRNLITGQLAKGWLSKDGTSIDQISKEFEMEGIDVSDQDIVDFIIRNPSNYVRKTSDTQNKLGRRFSETASKASGMPIGSPESVTGRLFIQNMQQGKTIEGMSQAVQGQALREDDGREEAFFNSIPDDDTWTDEQVMDGVLDSVEYRDGEYISSNGMALDEIDDIYSQLEFENNEREAEEADSQENEFADAFDEAREIEEPETSGVASVEDRENQEGNRGVGGLEESVLTSADSVNGEQADRGIMNTVLAHKEDLFDVDNSRKITQEESIQVTEATNKTLPFVAPEIKPDEDIVGYAERVVKSKELYDEQAKVNTEPSDAQKEAGNYKMGHVKIGGHGVTIENPKDSVRRGVDADGKAWETAMNNTYGYFRGTKGKDGDHVDVFLGENLNPKSVYVVDQVNEDGSFDEHKVMYGFDSVEDAREAYFSNYEKGWEGLGAITGVSHELFDEWLESGTKKQKPFAKYRIVASVADEEFTPLKELTKENIANFAGDEVQKRMALGYLDGNRNSINTIAYENLKNRINEFNRSRLLQSNNEGAISANGVNEETVSSDSGRDGRSRGYRTEKADRSLQGRIQLNNERPEGTETGSQSHMDGDGGNDGVRSNQSVQGITSRDVDADTGGVKPNGRNADSRSRDSVIGGRKKTDKNIARDAGKRRDYVSSLKKEQADAFILEINSKEGNLQQSEVDSNRPLPGESLQDFANRINNRRIEKSKENILDECTLINNNIKERIRAKIDISICRDESDVYSNMERNGESDSAISKVHEAFARSKENNRKFCGFLSSLSGNVYICAEEHLNSSVHPRTSIMHETTHKVIGDNYSKGNLVEWYNEIGKNEISKYVPKHYFEGELTDDKRASLVNEYFAHIIGMVSRRNEAFDNFLSGNLSFLDKLELPKTALGIINEISDLISSGYESRKFERDKREGSRSDNQPDGGKGVPEVKEDGGLEVTGSGEPGLHSGDAGELSRDRRERDDSDLAKSDVSFSEDGTPLDEILFLDAEGEDILRHIREDERSITQVIDSIRNIDRIKSNDLSKRTLGTRVAEGLFDDALKLKRLQVDVEAKRGSSLDGYMNPYQFITSIPKRNEYETERFNEKFMRPIYKSMRQIKDAGAKEKDIYAYFYAKSGIERNEKMRTKAMREYISNIKDDALRDDLLAESTGMTISEMVFTNETAEKKRVSFLSRDYSGLTELRDIIFDEEADRTEKHIQKWIEAFEEKHEVDTLWRVINRATKETLENEFRNGKIDKATKEKISEMYEYYLPLRNWEGEQAKDVWEYANGDQSEGIGNVVKKAFGRKTLAGNPIVNIGLMGQQSIHSGNRNILKQMFLSMARNNPNEAYSVSPLWIKNIGAEGSENWVETAPEWDDNPGVFAENVEKFDAEMEALKKEGRAMQKYTRGSVGMPITKMEANEHQVIVSEAGKRYIVNVNTDPAISRAINGIAGKAYSVQDGKALNNDFVQKVIRANGIIMRTMGKSFTTWNPMFILDNGQRDIMNALFIASVKEGKEYTGEIAKNMFSPSVHGAIMRAVMKNPNINNPIDKLFKEYESNGGETGFSELFKDSDFERQIKKELNKRNVNPMAVINVYLNNVERLNRWAENVSRFSTYKASRDSGRDIYRSVYDAKEITVNFNRKGTGACGGNFLRLAYIFSGAGLQAMYQMGRLSLNNKTRKKAAVLMTSVAIAGYLIPLMNNMLLGGDGDDTEDGYDFKPEYERKSNIMVRVGKGKYAKLSITQELRPFWNIGETLYQLTRGNINTWEAGINIGEGFAGVMPFDPFGSSGLVPTVLQPIDQARNNENFFGGKIYKDETQYNKYLPQWQRGFKNTSPIAVGLSKWLNDATEGDEATQGKIDISPGVMEHLVEGYFGGAIKFLNNIAKTTKGAVKAANGDSSFLETKNIPFLSTFYTDSSNSISKDVDRLYWDCVSLSERVGTRERKYKELMKAHPENAVYYQKKIVDIMESKDYECKKIIDKYYDVVSDMTELVNQDVLDGKSKTVVLEQIKNVKKRMLDEINNIK